MITERIQECFDQLIDELVTMAINIIIGQVVKTITFILVIVLIIVLLHVLEDYRRKRCFKNLTLPSLRSEMNHVNRWKHFSRKNSRYTKMFYNAMLNVKASENPDDYRISPKMLEQIEASKDSFDELYGLVLLSTNESLWFEKVS